MTAEEHNYRRDIKQRYKRSASLTAIIVLHCIKHFMHFFLTVNSVIYSGQTGESVLMKEHSLPF